MSDSWRVWEKEEGYGDLFYNRAIGKLPEMESSKAVAKIVATLAKENDTVMDVGCGAGHYLVSCDASMKVPFSYIGVDATPYYIELAKKAFLEGRNTNPLRVSTRFEVADIFDLSSKANSADIVMCNNVFLHLPFILKALHELWGATRRYLILRALIGKVSFRIKQINPPEEYTEDGEPVNFHYFNIYSEEYIKRLVDGLQEVKEYRFIEDKDYDPERLRISNREDGKTPHDLTTIINGMQVNNYIIQPWQFLIIEKN